MAREPVRSVNITAGKIVSQGHEQLELFFAGEEKNHAIDRVVDDLRKRFGKKTIAVLEGRVYIMEEFDEEICSELVERVKVLTPTHLVFELKNGLAIEQQFVKERGIHGSTIFL